MITRKKPDVSLKAKYNKVIRLGLIGALVVNIVVFLAIPKKGPSKTNIEQPDVKIEQVEIPQTEQYEKPPAPSRPTIPVASENEDVAEDVTIEQTTFEEFEAMDAPPPPPEGPKVKFVAYDEAPEPIGGYAAIQKNIKYPDIAQEAGIEGTVVIQAFVDKSGKVTDTVVLKGIPKTGLNEAAIEAIKKTSFKPAKQRDRAVGVWISIPVVFRLKNAD